MSVEALAGPDERLPQGRAAKGPAAPGPGPAGPDPDAGDRIGVRLRERGIVEVRLPPNQVIEGPQARAASTAVRALARGRRLRVLLVITGVVGVSVEARNAYVTSIASSAFALVGESPVDRVIAHYLLRSKIETVPAGFFTSESDAVEWLRQHARED